MHFATFRHRLIKHKNQNIRSWDPWRDLVTQASGELEIGTAEEAWWAGAPLRHGFVTATARAHRGLSLVRLSGRTRSAYMIKITILKTFSIAKMEA